MKHRKFAKLEDSQLTKRVFIFQRVIALFEKLHNCKRSNSEVIVKTSMRAGMNWGDGYISDQGSLKANPSISDPSKWFLQSNPNVVLAPHNYPSSITHWDQKYNTQDAIFTRCDSLFAQYM